MSLSCPHSQGLVGIVWKAEEAGVWMKRKSKGYEVISA
jgi:hypothetical protein